MRSSHTLGRDQQQGQKRLVSRAAADRLGPVNSFPARVVQREGSLLLSIGAMNAHRWCCGGLSSKSSSWCRRASSAGVTKSHRHQNPDTPAAQWEKKNWNRVFREPAVKRENKASGSAAGSSGMCPTAAPQTAMGSRVRFWRSRKGLGKDASHCF